MIKVETIDAALRAYFVESAVLGITFGWWLWSLKKGLAIFFFWPFIFVMWAWTATKELIS